MTLETIIDAMDLLVEGMFVIHQNISRNPVIKSKWLYHINLYYISPKKEKSCELSHYSGKLTTEDKVESLWEEVYKEFLPILIQYISSNRFINLKKDV